MWRRLGIGVLVGAALFIGCSGDDVTTTDAGVVPDASEEEGNGGGDGDGDGPGSGFADSCDELDCEAPASCRMSPAGAHCVCPADYLARDGRCVARDGDACNDDDGCRSGHCVGGICCAEACDEAPQCTSADDAQCLGGRRCYYPSLGTGESCEDGDPCTTAETCDADGACGGGVPLSCDDANECTEDLCDPSVTDGDPCLHDATNFGNPCDDGDACTVETTCNNSGSCSGMDVLCFDGDSCTEDICDSDDDDGDPCRFRQMDEGESCDDNDACTVGEACTAAGECIGGDPRVCEANADNPCATDDCDPATGCTQQNINGIACDDDDPCTLGDICAGGICDHAGVRECDDGDPCTDDLCDPDDTDSDPCYTVNNTAPCDDGNVCTSTDTCSDGSCVGDGEPNGDPCGPYGLCECAGAACASGTYTCACDSGYVEGGGRCRLSQDECLSLSICDPIADCVDPEPETAGSTLRCTCPAGTTDVNGDGSECNDVCLESDPCGKSSGRATGCAPATGGYSCTCAPGYLSVDPNGGAPTCACDLSGVYAFRIDSTLSWAAAPGAIEGASGVISYSWGLVEVDYDAQGNLEVVTSPCGGVGPDICNTYDDVAHAEITPNSIWGQPGMPTTTAGLAGGAPLIAIDDGSAMFSLEPTAAFLGLSLEDPFGEFPPCADCVIEPGDDPKTTCRCASDPANPSGGRYTHTITNPAVWTNEDGGPAGVTSYAQPPPGDTTATNWPEGPVDFGATSEACPRNSGGARWEYGWWPVDPVPYFFGRRARKFHTGGRTISQLHGVVEDCDAITGSVSGDGGGQMLIEGRIFGCEWMSPIGACPADTVEWLDAQPPDQEITSATFVMTRMANADTSDRNALCTRVRDSELPLP